jgi:uncharacterized protein YfaS (alpha-2-macroglobulin family)
MKAIAKILQMGSQLLLILILVLAMTSCSYIQNSANPESLPFVASLPIPQLPDWIEEISPQGEANTLAQIRIRFKEPLIPVARIDTPQQKSLLAKFSVFPVIPGKFRFLTPRMVGFQAEQALPPATRMRITLKAGLADLSNHRLDEDLAWTFNTEEIKLTNLPNQDKPIDIKPTLEFSSNVELDLASIRENLSLTAAHQQEEVSLQIARKKPEDSLENQSSEDKFAPSDNWIYTVKPRSTLRKATQYNLNLAPGLLPSQGNLPSSKNFTSKVLTYAPLKLEKIEAYGKPDRWNAYGRFVKGSPSLKFNNGLLAESVAENISINPPPPPNVKLVRAYDYDNLIQLNPWALEPAINYTITIDGGLKDEFGQTLGKSITLNYNTGDVAPDIWAPSDLNIFPAGQNLQLNIATVNLPESQYQAAYQVVQPTDLVYVNSAYPDNQGISLLPNSQQWSSFSVPSPKNKTQENIVSLRDKLGGDTGMVAYGVKAKTNTYQEEDGTTSWREPEFYGLVQLTNLGVFAQWFPESGLVRVNHLSDGKAVENATIEIYQSQLQAKVKSQPTPCAIAQTDSKGIAMIEATPWEKCHQNQEAPELLVIARENQDWAFTRTYQYSGSYEYGIYAGWDEGKPQSRGVIFSDRQLYQPGETAWFTGAAYYLQQGNIKPDQNASYQITLIDPQGKETDLGSQTTNQFATFSVELPLAKNQPLGSYSLRAKAKNGVEIYGDFRVAEFKPPNFQVELSLGQEFALTGQKVDITTQSKYLFGSPVQGGKVNYYVTRNKTDFKPPGWDSFQFGRQWFWPEEPVQVPSDVWQGVQVLDSIGKNREQVAVAQDLPYPMTYRVEAVVTDVSNLAVSSRQTFTALPSDRLIGLQGDFVATAEQAFPLSVIVTDPKGKAIVGEKVTLELQEMKYRRVTQLQEGSRTSRYQIEYNTIAQEQIRSQDESQEISFTPPQSGSYRIHANLASRKNDVTGTDLQIWATGENEVFWGDRYRNNRLEIQLDQENYQLGETATALIKSPYPEGELYFAVIKNNTIYSTLEKVTGGAPKIQFPVTEEMLPNAAVEAVLVRQGESLSLTEPGTVTDLVSIGFAPFETNLDEKYLQVAVTPQQRQSQPGTQQTINLELKDAQGNPTQGQFTVMVVNEAILQLTGYRPPDLMKTVYAPQEISTRLADNRPEVILTTPASPLEKGWGFGGGVSAGTGSTQIRQDFRPLAFYNGSVLSDAQGKARVSFTLPDDLTTWRVMVVATDGDLHFAQGDTTFISTKPLVTQPILPPFARLGDRFLGGVAVTQTNEDTGNLSIKAQVTNQLKLTDSSHVNTQATSGTNAYLFPLVAEAVGKAKVRLFTRLGSQKDAWEVPLEIKELEITEQAIASGTTETEVKIPLSIDDKVAPNTGGLDISLASTLMPEIMAPAEEVLAADKFPFLEPSASKLGVTANLEILGAKYTRAFTNFDLNQKATQALGELQKLQQADGGFAFFLGAKTSDPFVTPYAAEQIAQAQLAGFRVNPEMVNRLQDYLNTTLANPNKQGYCTSNSCKNQVRLNALIALAELGEKRQDFLPSLYQSYREFDFLNQIKLARYLSQLPQWQTEAQQLYQEIQETVYQTGRTATVNLPKSWSWFNSQTAIQAEALRFFLAQKAPVETLDRLLQGLLALRRDGVWGNNYDNAQALSALVSYSDLEPLPPKFRVTVQLARQQLGKFWFKNYRNPQYELKVPQQKLPRGENNLVLQKSGEGTLHYLTAYRYRLLGKQPGQLNGLRVARHIRLANQNQVIYKQDLSIPDQPLKVAPGEVFDVGLEIITDHPVDHLVITDPLPAGLEAVDTTFQTAIASLPTQEDSWEIGYEQIYHDKVVAYGNHLEAGVYSLHYLVRSVTSGTFEWPGAEVHLQYAPEEFGRSASSSLEVFSQPDRSK